MSNQKSTPSVKEACVSVSSDEEPEKTPGDCIRQYRITSASMWMRRFKIKEQPSQNVLYTAAFTSSLRDWDMLLTTGAPNNSDATIAGAAKISLWRSASHLALGDPSAKPDVAQRVELKLDSKWRYNQYVVNLPLPPAGNDIETHFLEMQWKGTNDVKGWLMKLDRGLHHKLVEKNSNRLLARYLHNPWNTDVAGTVEIFADIPGITPQEWDLFVLLGALAVTEKNMKIVKRAIHHMDDDPISVAGTLTIGIDTVEPTGDKAQSAPR
ncbi:MAG: hypothetical protein M1829_003853 [Trizodia sp. TS-e1964]|nr:MAG: hypothetical protein M1829_003853 [Trizodia sp. TS-e1964]